MVRRTIRPFTVEVRGSRRKAEMPALGIDEQPHVAWPDALFRELHEEQAEPAPEVVPDKPQGRILPALTEPEPPRVAPFERLAAPVMPEPEIVDEPDNSDEPEPVDAELEDDELEVPTPAPTPAEGIRERRPRKARETFARGERWKARLPAAIHGMRRRPKSQGTE